MKKISHSDHPEIIDAFQRDKFIDQVSQAINHCEAPKGIGINGYWGTGKTSALKQVYFHLSGETVEGIKPTGLDPKFKNDTLLPIWFEAWRYQHEQLPIIALLKQIRDQFSSWEKLKGKAKKAGELAFLGSLSIFDEVFKAASGGVAKTQLSKLPATANAWEAERFMSPLTSQKLNSLLEQAIDTVSNGKKIVIFIDDLDRCTPNSALNLLEGIKVYLNIKNCVVVFGMDQRQIEKGLVKALDISVDKDDKGEAEHEAREYLEKIWQDIFYLPIANQKHKAEYFNKLLLSLDLVHSSETNSTYKLDLCAEISIILDVHDMLPANPRKIKAIVNRVAVMLRKLKGSDYFDTEADNKISLVLAIAIIYCFHRKLYEQLDKNIEFIREIIAFAKAPQSKADEYAFIGLIPSINPSKVEIPTNPNDGNVFRLHSLFDNIDILPIDVAPLTGI